MKTGPKPFTKEELMRAFWSKVDKSGQCWLWRGGVTLAGYPMFHVNRKSITAHRFIFLREVGPVPKGQDVCHSCDTKTCVRPSHLFAGTRKTNMEDAKSKGRTARGERQGSAVLDASRVQKMRRIYAENRTTLDALAKSFGCSRTTAFSVVNRRTWTHV